MLPKNTKQEKKKVIVQKIKDLLTPGEIKMICKMTSKADRTVYDTLNPKHPLLSIDVINAALQYLLDNGRITENCILTA